MVAAANSQQLTHSPAGGLDHVLCSPGGYDLERVRFFPRQLIKADDLTQDQSYYRAKMRRHNRFLHGWGVVCGGDVTPAQADWTVCITPGYIVGPEGDEILIDCCVEVDLSRQDLNGNALICGPASDPWCSSVRVDRPVGQTLYVAVGYTEYPARPVHVQPGACSCGGTECEYSRVRDGYVVKVLDRLPKSYEQLDPTGPPFACPHGGVRQCPVCPADPWVILAAVTIRGKHLSAADIDNSTYRRYVASFADWWYRCTEDTPTTVMRQLIDIVGEDAVDPDLAVSVETPDDRSVVFKLEENVKMADGRSFDSGIARDTLDAHRDTLGRLGYVGATVDEPLTLVVELKPRSNNLRFLTAVSRIDFEVRS